MLSMKSWMLGAALVAGGLGIASTQAKAAEFGIYVGTPAAYVPPCPGPGYEWVAGYYADGYWVPGRWAFVGVGEPVVGFGYARDYYHRDFDHDWYRDHRDWDRDRDRHDWDRDRHDWDHDHDRGRDHFDHDRFRR